MSPNRITYTIFFILLYWIPVLSFSNQAFGRESKIIPSISLRTEYTDNLFISSSDVMDDFIYTASPGLAITERSERLDLRVKGHLDKAWYQENKELDGYDKAASAIFRYRVAQKCSLSSNASYSRDSRPDRDLDDTGLILDTTERHRYQGGFSGDYQISEKTSATMSTFLSQDDYTRAVDDSYDFNFYTINTGVFHRPAFFDSLTTIFCSLRYGRYNYQTSAVDYYSISTGAESDVTETVSIRFDLGARYTVSEFQVSTLVPVYPPFYYDIVVEDKRSRTWGGVGQIGLTYTGEFIHCNMSISHDIKPASGRDGSSERTSLNLSFQKRLTEELRLSVSGNYYANKAEEDEFSTMPIDEDSFRSTITSRYNVTRLVFLEAGFSFTKIMNDISDTKADRNLTFINYVHRFEID